MWNIILGLACRMCALSPLVQNQSRVYDSNAEETHKDVEQGQRQRAQNAGSGQEVREVSHDEVVGGEAGRRKAERISASSRRDTCAHAEGEDGVVDRRKGRIREDNAYSRDVDWHWI